jgi:hypothetical protein
MLAYHDGVEEGLKNQAQLRHIMIFVEILCTHQGSEAITEEFGVVLQVSLLAHSNDPIYVHFECDFGEMFLHQYVLLQLDNFIHSALRVDAHIVHEEEFQ